MQGVMIVYAVFAGIIISIFVIILVATIALRVTDRLRKRRAGSINRNNRLGGDSGSSQLRLRM